MKANPFLLSFILLIVPVLAMAQGGKTLKKNNIASQTTYEYFIAEGIKDPVVEKIEAYDVEGNVIERKEFNKLGEIKVWEAFAYNENGDVTEEKYMDDKGKVTERITYTYDEKLVMEKKYFDQKNRLYKKKTYKYTYREE